MRRSIRHQLLFSLALLLTLVPLSAAGPAPEWAVAVFPSGAEFSLEIAATAQQRQMGYMYRENVPAEEGMLFLFDEDDRHGFWMKNCLVSLDLIWLDAQFRVVEIHSDVPPCVEGEGCPSNQPMRPARYVLEVAAGRAAAEMLRVGDQLVIHSDPALQP